MSTGTKPSLVAAACNYVAILVFGERTKVWDQTMIYYSGGYTEEDLKPVASKLLVVHRMLASIDMTMLVKAKWDDIIKHPGFVEWQRTTSL